MKTLSTIIVDDEQDSIDILRMMLEDVVPTVNLLTSCRGADEAVEAIQKYKPDFIFLDIEMPGKDGFEVLKAFPDAEFKVVVVTGYEQYALRAIKYSALDYLLKPFDTEELKIALQKVRAAIDQTDPRLAHFASIMSKKTKTLDRIILPSNKGFRTLVFSDILSIESRSGNYCLFKLSDNSTTMATRPLYHYEELLPGNLFYRIHRSHIINMEKIRSYDNKTGILILEHDNRLEVSHRRRADFFKAYRGLIS